MFEFLTIASVRGGRPEPTAQALMAALMTVPTLHLCVSLHLSRSFHPGALKKKKKKKKKASQRCSCMLPSLCCFGSAQIFQGEAGTLLFFLPKVEREEKLIRLRGGQCKLGH